MTFYKGDDGILLRFRIKSNDGVVNITGATIIAIIKKSDIIVEKPADIIDAENGICTVTLSKQDIDSIGTYSLQGYVKFSESRGFYSKIIKFKVEDTVRSTQ